MFLAITDYSKCLESSFTSLLQYVNLQDIDIRQDIYSDIEVRVIIKIGN